MIKYLKFALDCPLSLSVFIPNKNDNRTCGLLAKHLSDTGWSSSHPKCLAAAEDVVLDPSTTGALFHDPAMSYRSSMHMCMYLFVGDALYETHAELVKLVAHECMHVVDAYSEPLLIVNEGTEILNLRMMEIRANLLERILLPVYQVAYDARLKMELPVEHQPVKVTGVL